MDTAQMATSGFSAAGKKASWRRKGQKPTEAQVAYAHGLGIDTTGMDKGNVADAINIRKLSAALPMAYPKF
jgi:hypothetical protein